MILWLLWDKLSLVTSVSECFEIIKTPFSYLHGDYTSVVENLKENFGTSYIWQKTMSDIMRHKVVCGHVGAGPGFGRVHIDNACVTFRSSEDVRILSQVTECYDCPLEEVKTLSEHGNSSFQVCVLFLHHSQSYHSQVNTRYPTLLQVKYVSVSDQECNKTYHFEQFGVYHLDTHNCGITVLTEYGLYNFFVNLNL